MSSPYDDIAEWYDQWVGEHAMSEDPLFAPVETLMGEVDGLRVCDLACGQGRVARYLADRGAAVVGVDLSAPLLAIAQRYQQSEPRGIVYRHGDVANLPQLAEASFDGVVCHMALMDIPELEPALQTVGRILRPGGWFVFSILHPCFNTAASGDIETPAGVLRTAGSYFDEGYWRSDSRPGPPGKLGAYHRTLSHYLNALIESGLQLECACEPRMSGDVPDSPCLIGLRRPIWAGVPVIWIARCRRA